MKWILPAFLFLVSLPCNAKELGFDVPKKVETRKLGLSQLVTPPQAIRETCWAFENSAVVWQEDPGLKGIPSITFRQSKDPAALCAANFSGTKRSISLEAGWPLGVSGDFLFVQDEPLGNIASFDVIQLSDGKKVFSSTRDVEKNLTVEKKSSSAGITYRVGLELSCVPAKSDLPCWEKIKNANHIPVEISVAAPNCETAFQKEPTTRNEARGLAVTVPAQVPDLAHPQIVYLPGQASCDALP